MSATTIITDVAGAATALGVLFGAAQLRLERSQAKTTFEDGLAVQYRAMIKPRLAEDLLAEYTEPADRDLVRRAERQDFEELRLLHETGYTDPRTWNPLWRRMLHRELAANDDQTRERAGAPPLMQHSRTPVSVRSDDVDDNDPVR